MLDNREIERAVTIRGIAATLAVGVLVSLIQASECAPLRCSPSEGMARREPPRPPVPSAEATEGPHAPETGPPPAAPPPVPAPASRPEDAPSLQSAPAPTSPLPRPDLSAALDLRSLEKRLRETGAIGVLTKLSLKNQVDDLLEEFRAFHQGRGAATLAELRERFDLLVLKVLALLQDGDATLARDISASREALWSHLADPATFRNL